MAPPPPAGLEPAATRSRARRTALQAGLQTPISSYRFPEGCEDKRKVVRYARVRLAPPQVWRGFIQQESGPTAFTIVLRCVAASSPTRRCSLPSL